MDRASLKDVVRRWGRAWARGWATHDADLIASLYEDGAVFRSQPFRDPQEPGAYARWAFEEEERAEVWFAEPVVEGERALVEWWAISRGKDGRDTTLAGAASIWFGDDGRVRRQLDYWNQADDTAQPPPDGWGPVLARGSPVLDHRRSRIAFRSFSRMSSIRCSSSSGGSCSACR